MVIELLKQHAMSRTLSLDMSDWGSVFSEITPYSWGLMGAGFSLSISIIGAAWLVFGVC